jgi:leader peptidase (prepilin peptidase) / N-methyltransferase
VERKNLMEWIITGGLVWMLGAAVGSFLNVVIYRIPAGLSLLHPPSRCPKCYTGLKPYDNVPVLGWLWLRGKCRYCRAPIAARYPLIEAFTACLFLAAFLQWGVSWVTLAYWALLSWLVALTFIDLDTLTLPNPLTQSGLLLGLAAQTVIPCADDGGLAGGHCGLHGRRGGGGAGDLAVRHHHPGGLPGHGANGHGRRRCQTGGACWGLGWAGRGCC